MTDKKYLYNMDDCCEYIDELERELEHFIKENGDLQVDNMRLRLQIDLLEKQIERGKAGFEYIDWCNDGVRENI